MAEEGAGPGAGPGPPDGGASLERVRAICAELPECAVEGGQHHKVSVRGKTIGWHTIDHHGDGRIALTVKVGRDESAAMVAADPGRFFKPPYVAQHGYVGVHLDVDDVDWDEVAELLQGAWRMVAPRSLVKAHDAR